ncbi:MAG: hypothetical protein V7K47_19410 [Nostoc sp.]
MIQGDRLLWKSECVSVAYRKYRFGETLKNNAIACCGRVSAIALQKTLKTKHRRVAACR